MKRENCINRNITIASAIISGVNILTFYNAFYKCFKFKYIDDFISLLCLLFSLMILINIKQHIRTIESAPVAGAVVANIKPQIPHNPPSLLWPPVRYPPRTGTCRFCHTPERVRLHNASET